MRNSFVMLLFVSASSFSQEWAEMGATWHYNHFPGNYSVFTIDGEQMVGGQMCRHINRSEDFSLWMSDQYEYTYYSSDTVYYWDADSLVFRILYDFGANPGEYWYYVFDGQNYQHANDRDSIKITVDSVDMISINSHLLKRLYVHYDTVHFEQADYNPMFYGQQNSEIIEFIGDVKFMFNTFTFDENTSEWISPQGLRCFQDTTIGFYDLGIVDSCDWWSDVSIPENDNGIQIYPNPATDQIYFEFNDVFQGVIHVTDAQGRSIEMIDFNSLDKSHFIDVSGYQAGVYYCVLTSNGSSATKKFVIAR